jgi:hypothetical protein
VIVEIKFTELYPGWVRDLVRELGLKQQPVPKYVMSVDALLALGPSSPLTLAGRTLAAGRT